MSARQTRLDGLGSGYHRIKVDGKIREFGIIWAHIWDPTTSERVIHGYVRLKSKWPWDDGPIFEDSLWPKGVARHAWGAA